MHEDHQTEVCGYCKGTGRKTKREPKLDRTPREKVVYSFRVPKDERENGAEVVRTLHVEAAILLKRDKHKSWEYYTDTDVYAHFLQNYVPDE